MKLKKGWILLIIINLILASIAISTRTTNYKSFLNNLFFNSILDKNVLVTKLCLILGVDKEIINMPDSSTGLMSATAVNNIDIAKHLINIGVNVNRRDKKGFSALKIAILNQHAELCDLLIDNNANVNEVYHDTIIHSPLFFSTFCAKDENGVLIAEKLLKAGAKVNYKSSLNTIPLYAAVRLNKHKIVKHLIDYGADVNFIDSSGNSLIEIAILNNSHKSLKYLLKSHKLKKDIKDYLIFTPVFNNNPEMLKLLIEYGLDVNFIDPTGTTTLHCAAFEGYYDIVKILLQKGANWLIKDKRGLYPIEMSIMHHKIKCAELLLSYHKGYKMNPKNKKKYIKVAKEKNNKEMLSFFQKL